MITGTINCTEIAEAKALAKLGVLCLRALRSLDREASFVLRGVGLRGQPLHVRLPEGSHAALFRMRDTAHSDRREHERR